MKKLLIATAAVACASVVMAQTVTSQNIVGYTKVTAPGGELTMAALNFDTGGATLQELIGTDLPNLSFIYVWDKGAGSYVPASLNARGLWSPNLVLEMGDALWIEPSGAGSSELIFAGEVLSATNSWSIPAGAAMTGYFYPVQKDLTTTQMADDVANLSFIYFWDDGLQTYRPWSKNARGLWSGTGTSVIDPRQGFWIDNAGGPIVVDEPVPFTP